VLIRDYGNKYVEKMFGCDEVTRWISVSGVLIAFITLAIFSKSINTDTDHPALSKRYKEAKKRMFLKLDQNEIDQVN
jgi:hypothetical protein